MKISSILINFRERYKSQALEKRREKIKRKKKLNTSNRPSYGGPRSGFGGPRPGFGGLNGPRSGFKGPGAIWRA